MTEYTDWKLDPKTSSIVKDIAKEQYGKEFRAQSRAGHEALILWVVFRADPSTRQQVLADHGFDSIADLVAHLDDGRFDTDAQFDPLAGVETPRDTQDVPADD